MIKSPGVVSFSNGSVAEWFKAADSSSVIVKMHAFESRRSHYFFSILFCSIFFFVYLVLYLCHAICANSPTLYAPNPTNKTPTPRTLFCHQTGCLRTSIIPFLSCNGNPSSIYHPPPKHMRACTAVHGAQLSVTTGRDAGGLKMSAMLLIMNRTKYDSLQEKVFRYCMGRSL